MTDFGNRCWPALPKVSQQRGDELRTEPRELTRGRTRPARVSRTVFRIQKSPLPGALHLQATTSGRNCHRDVNPRFCRSGLTPRADAVVEASDGDGRRRTTKQGRCRALGRALRLGARLSLRRWLGHESNCSFLIRRLRPGLRQNSSSCSRSPIRTYHLFLATRIRERPMLRRMVPSSPLTISASNFSNSKA